MGGKFLWTKFYECNLSDPFFDSLKEDYKEFSEWFEKKSTLGEQTLLYKDDIGICAFLYLKSEEEPIELYNMTLPCKKRIKIGTLKLDSRMHGQRLGEGAIGVALWRWQESNVDEIYLTVFEKHQSLIDLVKRFGFEYIGLNKRGEGVYLKSKINLNISDPFKAFPYIIPTFNKAGYIPINDNYHDTLFPYSELYNTNQEAEEKAASNGILKVYIGSPSSTLHHKVGEPAIIYRIHTGIEQKAYKSVATSFCTLTNLYIIKSNRIPHMKFDDFVNLSGNKTVFSVDDLKKLYNKKDNLILMEMVYNGYFGKGHNITYKNLSECGYFQGYPYNIQLTKDQFINILEMGGKNVQNVIINQSSACR